MRRPSLTEIEFASIVELLAWGLAQGVGALIAD